jgi:hypothetical protein
MRVLYHHRALRFLPGVLSLALVLLATSTGWCGAVHLLATPHDGLWRRIIVEENCDPQLKREFHRVENILLPAVIEYFPKSDHHDDMDNVVRPAHLPSCMGIPSTGMLPQYSVSLGDVVAIVCPNRYSPPRVAIYLRVDDNFQVDMTCAQRCQWEREKLEQFTRWLEAQPVYQLAVRCGLEVSEP